MPPELWPRSIFRIPETWIGIWKDWADNTDNIADALVAIAPAELATHAYVLGSTGSGKTVAITHLIAADILRGRSIVVLDARGDLASSVIELAARAGVCPSRVKFFNFRNQQQPLGFNPFFGAGDPYFKALGLIDGVAADSQSWGVQLEESFRNAALLLAEISAPITELDRLFHDRAYRLAAIAKTSDKQLAAFWNRFDGLSPDKQTMLAAPVLNKISSLSAVQVLRRTLGHPSPVDLGQHLRTPGTVTVISLAADQLHSAAWRMGSLFLNSICREVFSQVDIPESRRNAVTLYVDEFELFPSRPFEQVLAEGRRFKLAVCLGHQNLSQLDPKFRATVLGNVGTKLIFRSSHADAEILNRDLTGVRGAFDIARLGVGEAVLWRRGQEARFIEINAPLIQDVGRTSPLAELFLAQVREHEQKVDWTAIEGDHGYPICVEDDPPRRKAGKRAPRTDHRDLGDWLQ